LAWKTADTGRYIFQPPSPAARPAWSVNSKWRVNEFECPALKVFVKQALIFQKLAGGGLSRRRANLLFCEKANWV
jgi:hypothetical protein